MAARSKVWICCLSLVETADSIPAGRVDIVSCECCVLSEFSVWVDHSSKGVLPIVVSECDLETSK